MMTRLAPVLLVGLVTAAAPALAAPCGAPRQLKLHWDSVKERGQLISVAYECAAPTSCPVAAGTMATTVPIDVSVRNGDVTLFQARIESCDRHGRCRSINSGGCAGGGDAHKGLAGLVKLGYPKRGGASVMTRLRAPMTKPPENIEGPVTLLVTDAGGQSFEATFTRCRSHSRATSAVLVCR